MSQTHRYLCFNLGTEEFAIPLLSVREVIGVPDITLIPQVPAHFLGIMNLRGLIISVMDLRLKLGLKPQRSEETAVIILDLGDYRLGMMVDQVNAVVQLSENQIAEKPALEESKINDAVTGVFRKNEQLVLLLNVAQALSVEDRSAVTRAQAS
ncbi:MAG: chemotaxis protein CheW [Bdellovibrionales bacterium]